MTRIVLKSCSRYSSSNVSIENIILVPLRVCHPYLFHAGGPDATFFAIEPRKNVATSGIYQYRRGSSDFLSDLSTISDTNPPIYFELPGIRR